MSVQHDLKSWPEFFQPIMSGEKTFDVRRDDRHFNVGDVLRIREWDDRRGIYTGRQVTKRVTYVMQGVGVGGIEPLQGVHHRYVVMSLADLENGEQ